MTINSKLSWTALLERLDVTELSTWLRKGIGGYYCRGEGRFAFAPAENFIRINETLGLDLAYVYGQLDDDARSRFRTACQLALDSSDQSTREGQIVVKEILLFAGAAGFDDSLEAHRSLPERRKTSVARSELKNDN